ncbi:Las1-domain-containing protein [Macrolepiota fuliginosa MF-IS2]|uniref:Las1-domain-containing protein n=1 Tax=Macrolepiota fuliginosa MF-IS2 TaxID=1400762 RepID=A0A9P5XP48_9AGAR|nr:Las1-domain-containing protein [Macrolepiota fuliginosa MF-IS2]
MRLPRRVPWASLAELDQVCAWIYTDEHDLDAKVLAINRLSAWKAITPLPHALESTLALLVTIQQDKSTQGSSLNHLSLRHGYAATIIRLVNGLVDPLQLGAYARSIASIAAQLGLPAWLVELRHAATHEDLPSIELLREAAQQSMGWLLQNYFLPTINPASAPQRQTPPLRPLWPFLKQYKTILKTVTRDASLRTRYKQEVNAIIRDIERWIAEAKVAANVAVGEIDWDTGERTTGQARGGDRDDNMALREKWALEQFCDALLEKGGLVPVSKRKRVFPEDKFWPPQLSVSLWTPLLKHVQVLHADFAYTLCTRILSILFPNEPSKTASIQNDVGVTAAAAKTDSSYDMCLARWVMWSLDTWSNPGSNFARGEETDINLGRDIAVLLLQAPGHRLGDTCAKDSKAIKALLQVMCSQNPAYTIAVDFLEKPSSQFVPSEWTDSDITTMTDRLTQLLSPTTRAAGGTSIPESASAPTATSAAGGRSGTMEADASDNLPDGWRRVEATDWKPCPIGVFHRV